MWGGSQMKVKRTDRGWAGHFICASRCRYRRNTLLEAGRVRVVVSSVGLLERREYDKPDKDLLALLGGTDQFDTIGAGGRMYETMAFHAKREGPYWEADVQRDVHFTSPWSLNECKHESDLKMDKQHERVVAEISRKMAAGAIGGRK